ncbi:hypothetical protein NDU88_006652 [Pleurodeles waltl]|uniref:Uncharacterized protein n=1 Tax=Pleurodeles waltl TaxID=8319 RepID=A0AAV7LPT1_PLEWA|nr:hypothetical protein NDU88_006652 [Pleurodeles waltl]
MTGSAGQGRVAAKTARCTRDSAAAPGSRAATGPPAESLQERGEKPRRCPPPLHEGIAAGVDPRVGRPSPTEVKTAAPRAVIPCSGPRRRKRRGQGIKVGPWPRRAGQDPPHPPHLEYCERGAPAGCLELRPPPAPPDRCERQTRMAVAQGEVRLAALKGHT